MLNVNLPETQPDHELLDATNEGIRFLHQKESEPITHEQSAE